MSDLNETLHKLEALQTIYESEQAKLDMEAGAEDLVAAIDIGSTFTRCAFSFRNDDECLDLYVCNFRNPLTLIETKSNKTPTCLLLSKGAELVAFGYEAQKDFADLKENAADYLLFDSFFHNIHEEANLNAATMIESCNGQGGLPALSLMTHVLMFLKKHISKEASSKTNGKAHRCACWVLTVPSMWDETKRRFLREAALQAGLISEINSSKLRIITAEEAAFQYCSGLDSDDFIGKPPRDKLSIEPGDKYLVVDIGGCTLSATAYQHKEGGTSRELHSAMSCGLVGNHVDEVYTKLLEKIFGTDFINYMKQEKAGIWQTMMSTFVENRLKITNETTGKVKIEVLPAFKSSFEKMKGVDIEEAIHQSKIGGFKYVEPNIWIAADIIRSFYKRIIDFIVCYIRGLIENTDLKGIKLIYIVGGFVESEIVRSALFKEMEYNTILIPTQPSQAVSMCALLLGLEPDMNEYDQQ